MKIGVVGTGNMGRSIGIRFAEQGYDVLFGARDAGKAKEAARLAGRNAQAGSNDEAARFGDVVVWGVRGIPAAQVIGDLSVLLGKPVIDMNNNETPSDGGSSRPSHSAAELLQIELAGALVVKAFNTLPMEVFEVDSAELRRRNVSVYLAADDEAAKTAVRQMVEELGFTVVDCGALKNAKLLESLADLVRTVLANGGSPWSCISVVALPMPETLRLGGRKKSKLK